MITILPQVMDWIDSFDKTENNSFYTFPQANRVVSEEKHEIWPGITLDYLKMALLAEQKPPNRFQNVRTIHLRDVPLTDDKSISRMLKNGATYRVYFSKLDNCPGLCDVHLFKEKPEEDCLIEFLPIMSL